MFFFDRVHELFLYNDDLKKAKFNFKEIISHRNPETNKLDMKVRGDCKQYSLGFSYFTTNKQVEEIARLQCTCIYM